MNETNPKAQPASLELLLDLASEVRSASVTVTRQGIPRGRRPGAGRASPYVRAHNQRQARLADEWAEQLREPLYELLEAGRTRAEVADEWNERGMRTKTGRPWSGNTVGKLETRLRRLQACEPAAFGTDNQSNESPNRH